jgi:hypothetical protein
MKMPLPMTVPITIAIAAQVPKSRFSSVFIGPSSS